MKTWRHVIVAPLLLLSVVGAQAGAVPKTEVAIFEYEGVGTGNVEKFGTFRGILRDKISNLIREVLHGEAKGFDYLQKVSVNFRAKDTFTKPEGVNLWLKNETSVLCLLRGTMISDDNVTYLVKTNVHLGELKEYFPYDVVKITLPIKSTEFGNTQDSHSLVILYALAMDAKRLGYNKDHILRFLSAAFNKLDDIKRRRGVLGDDLAALEKALRKAAAELRGGSDGD